MAPKRKLPASEVLAPLYTKKGMSLDDIADLYGVTKQAVSLALIKAGVEMRPSGRPPEPVDEEKEALKKEVAALKRALLYVLDFHFAPGDPAYDGAQRIVPLFLPERKCTISFHDDKTG